MPRSEPIYCYSANLVWGQQQPLFPVLIEFIFIPYKKYIWFYSLFQNKIMSSFTNLHSDNYTDDSKSGY